MALRSKMEERPHKVAPGTYLIEVPFVLGLKSKDKESVTLCYLIEEEAGWLMIDSGYNDGSSFDHLCRQLDFLNTSLKQIRWLLLTHYHPDHSGLANRIKAVSGAEVIMHQDDWSILQATVGSSEVWNIHGMIPWARSLGVPDSELEGFFEIASLGRDFFPRGLEPDIILRGETNPVGDSGRLRAILTPGHTPGHICVYDQENSIFFSGDHVLVEITPHISPSHMTSQDQLKQYLEALRKVRPLDVKLVLPAHERPFTHFRQRVDEILAHHDHRLSEVVAAISDRVVTPWEIAREVEWNVGEWAEMDATNRVLAVRETLAHLQLLEHRGAVVQVERNGPVGYKLAKVSL
jgi:glyoxylase-like metal-dependent hydrolase (beta-lactamase superfamily II)